MTWYPNKIEVFRIEPENLVPRLWFVVTYTPNRRSTTPSAFTIAYSLYVSMEKRRNLPLVRKIEPSSSGPTAVGFDLRTQDAITRKLALHVQTVLCQTMVVSRDMLCQRFIQATKAHRRIRY